MIILGIDPGSRLTGYGLIQKTASENRHVENGTFYLEQKKTYVQRLASLFESLTTIIITHKPQVLAVENIFSHKNPKSIQKLSEARGIVLLCGELNNLEIAEYTPTEVKKAVTGYGNASKKQMQLMIARLLRLTDLPEENASDALSVALCYAHTDNQLTNSKKPVNLVTSKVKKLLGKASFYR